MGIWTGGRKCNFKGCDRKDLQPAIQNGWYWAPIGKRIPPPRKCRYCEWSRSGGLKKPSQITGRPSRAGRTRVALESSTTSTTTASSGTTSNAGTRSQSFVRRVTSFLILLLERKTNWLPSLCLICIVFIVSQYKAII